jgi:putative transposase
VSLAAPGRAGRLDEDDDTKEALPEHVVRKLAQADRLGEGKDVADIYRELAVSEQTCYRWRNQFGGLKADDDAKRLKHLERENSTLKRLIVTELEKARVAGDRPRKLQARNAGGRPALASSQR